MESDWRDSLANIKIIQPFLSDSKKYTVVSSLPGTGEDSGDFLKVFYCQILSGDNFEPIKSESVCRLYLKTKEIVRFQIPFLNVNLQLTLVLS